MQKSFIKTFPRPLNRLFAIFLALSLLACQSDDFETLDGHAVSVSDWQGQWVLINYWAHWCRPCLLEIPELNKLHHDMSVTNKKIKVFGVNFDGVLGHELEEQASQFSIEFPILIQDPSQKLGYQRPNVVPATYLIGPDGQVKDVLLGPQTYDSILTFVKKWEP